MNGVDVGIEVADRAEGKTMIANSALEQLPGIPLLSASGLTGYDVANDLVTERIGDGFYLMGDQRRDVKSSYPLLAQRVMVAAAHEAHAAIRILPGHPEP